jgi:hypothetical protein
MFRNKRFILATYTVLALLVLISTLSLPVQASAASTTGTMSNTWFDCKDYPRTATLAVTVPTPPTSKIVSSWKAPSGTYGSTLMGCQLLWFSSITAFLTDSSYPSETFWWSKSTNAGSSTDPFQQCDPYTGQCSPLVINSGDVLTVCWWVTYDWYFFQYRDSSTTCQTFTAS